MSELKVCAHCGHEAARKELRYYGETETWAYCPNPDCPMHDRTMTIKAWQTRPIEDALNARIAELEAENAALKAEPKPLAYWSDEKKQTYADNEGRSAKRSEE